MHAYLHIQMKSSYFHLVFPNNHHVVEHCFAFSYTLYDFGVGAFIVHKCMITDQRERQRERECISCEGRERAPANNRASKTRAATQNSTSRVCVVACGVVVVVPPVPRRVPFTRVHTFRFLRFLFGRSTSKFPVQHVGRTIGVAVARLPAADPPSRSDGARKNAQPLGASGRYLHSRGTRARTRP